MSTTIDPTTAKDINSDLRPMRMDAQLVQGLAEKQTVVGDRELRQAYVETLGRIAQIHIERLRRQLP